MKFLVDVNLPENSLLRSNFKFHKFVYEHFGKSAQ